MGLLDSLLGGGSKAGAPTSSSVSPMVKAVLLLLAAKAAQSMTSRTDAQTDATGGADGQADAAASGGLGGLLGGAGAAGMLGGLIEQLRARGFGDQVDSWIGTGRNTPIGAPDMARALGPDAVSELEQQTGLPRDELLAELSHELPDSIDRMTPDGRLPSDDDIWSGQKA